MNCRYHIVYALLLMTLNTQAMQKRYSFREDKAVTNKETVTAENIILLQESLKKKWHFTNKKFHPLPNEIKRFMDEDLCDFVYKGGFAYDKINPTTLNKMEHQQIRQNEIVPQLNMLNLALAYKLHGTPETNNIKIKEKKS